ncbi:MAG: GNAT family N-acetyltransferase [FCB group bacterium]|jgi:hypothetical protein|nr:GNAT family N-acetyltransferase [FCB group bacterium]
MRDTETVVWDIGRDAAAYAAQWASDAVDLPYLSPGWLGALNDGMGHDIRVHAVLRDGRMTAAVALRRASRCGITVGRKPWATAYNAWTACGASHDSGLFAHLMRRYWSVRGVFAPCTEVRRVECGGAARKTWGTLVLDVRDVERCWLECDRHARQRVRKARGLGVTVALTDDADAFERLYRHTYSRQDLSLPLRTGAIAQTVGLARRGGIELYLAATATGEPAAGLVVGWGTDRGYFMLAASHPDLRKTDAVSLLWWTVIEEASRRVSTVDLVGAATPEIERFKRSFSPSPVDCLEVVWEALPLRFAKRLARNDASGNGVKGIQRVT